MVSPNHSEMMYDFVKYGRVKHCHHPDKTACQGKIIQAHSVQKERILSQIEDVINKNKLLYSLNDYIDENHKIVGLSPIGKSKASIFTGFCDYHDKMFSAIENNAFIGSDEQNFLFAYRAFTHGLHQLLEILAWYQSQSPVVKLFPTEYVLHFKQVYNNQLAKFIKIKQHLDQSLLAKKFSACNHLLRVFDFIPLASSTVLSPFYTYKNIYLNPAKHGSYLILNIIPDGTQTSVLISHIIGDHVGKVFFDELKTLTNDEFTEAISSLLLYCTSNTFFSPKLWDNFSLEQRQLLYDDLNFATFEGDKIKAFHQSKVDFFKIYYSKIA